MLHRVKKEREVLHTIKIKKAKWIGHILRVRCLLRHLRHATEGRIQARIEVTGRGEGSREQLLNALRK